MFGSNKKMERGQSLMEIVFAIAIFTIGVVTIGYLIIEARISLKYSTDVTKARLIASEGIEAVGSIKTGGFSLIPAGSYGLVLEDGLWKLSSSTDSQGKFNRVISIEDNDVDNKTVTSIVTWNEAGGEERVISYVTQFSNWMQLGDGAGNLEVGIDSVNTTASGTVLMGLSILNSSSESITISEMIVDWDSPAKLDSVLISGVEVYSASTSGLIESGESIDIVDYTLNAYTGFHPINQLLFDDDVSGTSLIMRFIMSDGSARSVYISK